MRITITYRDGETFPDEYQDAKIDQSVVAALLIRESGNYGNGRTTYIPWDRIATVVVEW